MYILYIYIYIYIYYIYIYIYIYIIYTCTYMYRSTYIRLRLINNNGPVSVTCTMQDPETVIEPLYYLQSLKRRVSWVTGYRF